MRKIDSIIVHCSATKAGQDFTAADIDRWHRNVGSTASDIIMLSVWTEDWRKEGKLICLEHIAKVGMSEVSGSVYRGWMRTDIRQILGQMFKNGCFIK